MASSTVDFPMPFSPAKRQTPECSAVPPDYGEKEYFRGLVFSVTMRDDVTHEFLFVLLLTLKLVASSSQAT
jgi:hypothetical protein